MPAHTIWVPLPILPICSSTVLVLRYTHRNHKVRSHQMQCITSHYSAAWCLVCCKSMLMYAAWCGENDAMCPALQCIAFGANERSMLTLIFTLTLLNLTVTEISQNSPLFDKLHMSTTRLLLWHRWQLWLAATSLSNTTGISLGCPYSIHFLRLHTSCCLLLPWDMQKIIMLGSLEVQYA